MEQMNLYELDKEQEVRIIPAKEIAGCSASCDFWYSCAGAAWATKIIPICGLTDEVISPHKLGTFPDFCPLKKKVIS